MFRCAAAVLVLFACAPSFAADAANAVDDGSRARLRVSLSRDDMKVSSMKVKGEVVQFYIFVDGYEMRGADFGLKIEGGEFLGYVPNFEGKAWQPMLIPDPYPGTICQAGLECYPSPCLLGKVIMRLKKPGEKIVVDVTTSAHQQHAVVMNCDYSTENGLFAYPAAVNTSPPAPHPVDGVELVSQGWPLVPEEESPSPAAGAPPDSAR